LASARRKHSASYGVSLRDFWLPEPQIAPRTLSGGVGDRTELACIEASGQPEDTLLAGVAVLHTAVLHKERNRSDGTVTFTQVNVPRSGTDQVKIDELRSGLRSFSVRINGGASFHL